jgi:hypothetical protein
MQRNKSPVPLAKSALPDKMWLRDRQVIPEGAAMARSGDRTISATVAAALKQGEESGRTGVSAAQYRIERTVPLRATTVCRRRGVHEGFTGQIVIESRQQVPRRAFRRVVEDVATNPRQSGCCSLAAA